MGVTHNRRGELLIFLRFDDAERAALVLSAGGRYRRGRREPGPR
jgi:hypothetical protein